MASTNLPMGVRFHPSDEEKMSYLVHMVHGQPLPSYGFIDTDDLYGNKEPWEVFGDNHEDETERYFFTRLKKVAKKTGQRFSRNVGKGTWSNKGLKTPIYGQRRQVVIGYKRNFRYERKKNDDVGDDQNGKWLLKEYILPINITRGLKDEYKDYALCVLKRKGSGNRRRENEKVEEVEPLPLLDYPDVEPRPLPLPMQDYPDVEPRLLPPSDEEYPDVEPRPLPPSAEDYPDVEPRPLPLPLPLLDYPDVEPWPFPPNDEDWILDLSVLDFVEPSLLL